MFTPTFKFSRFAVGPPIVLKLSFTEDALKAPAIMFCTVSALGTVYDAGYVASIWRCTSIEKGLVPTAVEYVTLMSENTNAGVLGDGHAYVATYASVGDS
jgi:hypothetical protein